MERVGYSIGLYAKVRNIDTKKAYRELLDRECFSINASNIVISPINDVADLDKRDAVYRDFLNMLKLDSKHRKYLEQQGLLKSSIEHQMYRSVPKKEMIKRLMANKLQKKHGLAGIAGFFQNEDWGWNFINPNGFFIPVLNQDNKIQALSIHLDNPFNNATNIWFSSKGKINGTICKNYLSKSNITKDTETVVLTDNLILGNLIKEITNAPLIAFSSITNSYQILKVLDNTNIKNIIFTIRDSKEQKLDYIINRVFKDLIPLGYNLETRYIKDYRDILADNFLDIYKLEKVA